MKKPKINTWYVTTDGNVIYITRKQNNCGWYESYGFNNNHNWMEGNGQFVFDENRHSKATEEEVFKALKKEAIKRGLWDNPNVVCLYLGKKNTAKNLEECFDIKNGDLWSKYGKIFDKGVWTTKIETITKEEAEKQLNKIII